MSELPPPLPEALEEEVLRILDGDDAARDGALRTLLAREPQHAAALRRWLAESGVTVPGTAAPGAVIGAAGAEEALPRRIGPYLLRELLGRGGFGSVYRAEQQEPIRRPVAVKVLNAGMDSREVLARFAAEREALNRMDHPGIARLLDAGQTAQGRPFFVMELVEGPTLRRHCQQAALPIPARLQLFLQVLDAVQHAHQKAVLHRDLSSNNVLVADPAGRAQPKVIDFGIAKSLRDPLLQGGAMTFQGTLLGTPEFMSPEQAAGRGDVDTRTDVYALGVQLYELLTDTLPIPGVVLRAQGLAGMAQAIAAHRIAPPSEIAPAERRAALRGDLDAIALRALQKSPDDRYPTVAELAADLRRHLAHEPVAVATPTTFYRLRKFVRRHRAQSTAVAIVALGLLLALGVLLHALRLANDARQAAERQREQLAQKADAGFRLLANDERLNAAIAAAAALPAPWPQHERAYAGWLREHAEPLLGELPKLRTKIAELQNQRAAQGGRFADPVDQHLLASLQRLDGELAAFAAPGGPRDRVQRQLRRLREQLLPLEQAHAAAWQQVLEAIQQSDDRTASAAYRGVQLKPLPGLLPLGMDPHSRLHEFLDLGSHPPAAPLPSRDPAGGALRLPPDCGIVFVLLPPGTVRLGAFRSEPGLPQNDPAAADDELGGEVVRLEEFLLARTELTQAQWAALAELPPPPAADAALPQAGLAWNAARAVLARYAADLPTEAQWEYACRAGGTAPFHCGAAEQLAAHAWFGPRPQPVGRLQPNAFGLFDLHGNLAEWCRDGKLPYGAGALRVGDGLRTPAAAEVDEAALPRVVRGGAHHQDPAMARCSARAAAPASLGRIDLGLRPIRRWR